MLSTLGTSVRMTIVSVILLGFVYPFVMTGLARTIFPAQAGGSMVTAGGRVVGSEIVGQLFTKPQYFHGRPSAAGKNGYDPTATGGTNLGPTSKKLIDATRATIKALRKENPDASGEPPMDLVTTSASGIDPDISPQAAYYQAARVAMARGMSVLTILKIVDAHTSKPLFGFIGEPHVNVLDLNIALDASGSRAPK